MPMSLLTDRTPITKGLFNGIIGPLAGSTGLGTDIQMTELSNTTRFALSVRNKDATNGLHFKVTDSGDNKLFSVTKNGTFATKYVIGSEDTGDTDNHFLRRGADDIELYIGGIRKMRFTERGVIFGPVDSYPSGSQTIAPYAVIEWTDPIDGNNVAKAQFGSLTLQEVKDDPGEINIRRGGNSTVGGAMAQIPDSTAIGFLMWWGQSNTGTWEKLAQVTIKNTEAITATGHGAGVSIFTVPNGTVSEPRPGITQGPDRRVLFDDTLNSGDNNVWNSTYMTTIEERFAIRGGNNPGMTIKNNATVAIGNKVYYRAQMVAGTDAWAAGNGAFMAEIACTQASPLKTEVGLYSNTGGAPTLALKLRDDAKAEAPNGMVVGAVDPPIANLLTAASFSKGWAFVSIAAGTPTLVSDYNVSGIVDGGVGLFTIQWDLDFSTAPYPVFGMANDGDIVSFGNAPAVGSVDVRVHTNAGALTDTGRFCVVAFGSQ